MRYMIYMSLLLAGCISITVSQRPLSVESIVEPTSLHCQMDEALMTLPAIPSIPINKQTNNAYVEAVLLDIIDVHRKQLKEIIRSVNECTSK